MLNNERFVRGTDASALGDIFAQLGVDEASHAFYLGTELAKAGLAVALGKTYRQDQALTWGYLTPPETRETQTYPAHRARHAGAQAARDRRKTRKG